MDEMKFKLDLKGLNELMKSPEMQSILDEAGQQVADIAGEGYECETRPGRYIAFANIFPTTYAAKDDEMKNNTLEKAIRQIGLSMTK